MDLPLDVTVTALVAQQERIRKQEQEIKAKKAKIKAFQGLSPVRPLSAFMHLGLPPALVLY